MNFLLFAIIVIRSVIQFYINYASTELKISHTALTNAHAQLRVGHSPTVDDAIMSITYIYILTRILAGSYKQEAILLAYG